VRTTADDTRACFSVYENISTPHPNPLANAVMQHMDNVCAAVLYRYMLLWSIFRNQTREEEKRKPSKIGLQFIGWASVVHV
jgi:hypothetical protein